MRHCCLPATVHMLKYVPVSLCSICNHIHFLLSLLLLACSICISTPFHDIIVTEVNLFSAEGRIVPFLCNQQHSFRCFLYAVHKVSAQVEKAKASTEVKMKNLSFNQHQILVFILTRGFTHFGTIALIKYLLARTMWHSRNQDLSVL